MEFNNSRNSKDKIIGYFFFVLSLFSGLISFFISIESSTPRLGLEFLYFLPLSFVIFVLIFHRNYFIQYKSFPIPILFTIIIFRYSISPALIYITKDLHYTRMVPTSSSYQLAIFISIIELLSVFIALRFIKQNKFKENHNEYSKFHSNDPRNLNFLQIIIILILGLFLVARYTNFFYGLYFLIPNDAFYNSGAYEGIVFLALKSYIFIRVLIFTRRQVKNRNLYFLVAFFSFVINITLSYGSNRSLILINLLASTFIFIYCYPKESKISLSIALPIISTLFISLIFYKQFGIELDSISNLYINAQNISEDIEMYVNGMWPLASSFELVKNGIFDNNLFIQIYTDFVKNFFPFLIPGFNFPVLIVQNYNTSAGIYNLFTNNIGAMFPLAGQIYSYFGFYGGFFMNILAHILLIRLLLKYDDLSLKTKSIELKYYYALLSILFAFIMNYTIITFIWSWSKNIFLIYLLILCGRILKPKYLLSK